MMKIQYFLFRFLNFRKTHVVNQAVDYEQSLFFLGPSSKTPETRNDHTLTFRGHILIIHFLCFMF